MVGGEERKEEGGRAQNGEGRVFLYHLNYLVILTNYRCCLIFFSTRLCLFIYFSWTLIVLKVVMPARALISF